MVLILVKSPDSFRIYNQNLIRAAIFRVLNLDGLIPDPKALSARVNCWPDAKTSFGSLFIQQYSIEQK